MTKPLSFDADSTIAPISLKAAESSDYRALVCVYLPGGNDSHNMIIPRNGSANRLPYDTERGVLAVADSGSPMALDANWRFNPSMTDVSTLYSANKLAVLMNAGYLKEPTNRTSYLARTVKLPDNLYSHNSQQALWQALPPFTSVALNGWMGRAGELVSNVYNPSSIDGLGACFSIAGRNLQMQGYDTASSDMGTSGPVGFSTGASYGTAMNGEAHLLTARRRSEWNNVLQTSMADRIARAVAGQASLANSLQALPTTPNARFDAQSANSLAQQLRVVARIIASRSNYGHRRDLFLVSLGGWDDHDNLVTGYGPRVALLSTALKTFWDALGDLSMQEQVTTFTESEFGRALKANNNGSDHGWGGHHLIMGGSVLGGQIYGTPPNLNNGSINDASQGRMIPSTSVEQYAGTLLNWWGVPEAQLPLVLENIERFTPRVLPMMREPVPAVTQTPVLKLNLMDGYTNGGLLHPSLTVSRASGATMFDSAGRMVMAPCNLLTNSDATRGTRVGNVYGGALDGLIPTNWVRSQQTGIKQDVVGFGTLPTGEKYIDVRTYGTNNGGSTAYPYFFFSTGASAPAVAFGQRVALSVKCALIAGSKINGGPYLSANTTNNGTYAGNLTWTDGGPSALNIPDGEFRKLVVVGDNLSAGANGVNPAMFFQVNAGQAVDFTLRLSEPQVEYSCATRISDAFTGATPMCPYIETTTGPRTLARFDHDPVTLRPRGLLPEHQSTNVIPKSNLAGVVVGTPGTHATSMGVSLDAASTGVFSSVVGMGSDNGIPFIDVRVFGTPSANDTMSYSFLLSNSAAVAAGTSQVWTASTYAALKAGALPSALARVRVSGRVDGAYSSESTSAVGLLAGIKDLPLAQQRFQASLVMTNAAINFVHADVRMPVLAGVYIDFTLRLGGMQLEAREAATSYIQTNGSAQTRAAEVIELAGTPFTSVFNPTEGTLVCKYASGVPADGPAIAYPAAVALSDGTAANLIRLYAQSNTRSAAGNVIAAGVDQIAASISGVAGQGRVGQGAVAYKANDFAFSYRGGLVVDASGVVPTGINRLRLGGWDAGRATCWVQSIEYYNTRLPDASLVLLTSS